MTVGAQLIVDQGADPKRAVLERSVGTYHDYIDGDKVPGVFYMLGGRETRSSR